MCGEWSQDEQAGRPVGIDQHQNDRPSTLAALEKSLDIIAAIEIAIKRNALTLAFTVLALVQPGQCLAQESSKSTLNAEQSRALELEGISTWLRDRYSQSELEALRPGDLWLESHFCGCNDVPTKHFPYAVVLLATPKGDLVARPERHEIVVRFTALAVRYGDRYCDLESEASCYGSFLHPCDFTDFRYGRLLVDFFPTCKAD